MIGVLAGLLELVSAALKGRKSDEQIARELIDAAFESGVPAVTLFEYLSERGRDRAEYAADLAQWLKTGGR